MSNNRKTEPEKTNLKKKKKERRSDALFSSFPHQLPTPDKNRKQKVLVKGETSYLTSPFVSRGANLQHNQQSSITTTKADFNSACFSLSLRSNCVLPPTFQDELTLFKRDDQGHSWKWSSWEISSSISPVPQPYRGFSGKRPNLFRKRPALRRRGSVFNAGPPRRSASPR